MSALPVHYILISNDCYNSLPATFFSSKVSVDNCSNVVDLSLSGIILPHSGIALNIELLQDYSRIPYLSNEHLTSFPSETDVGSTNSSGSTMQSVLDHSSKNPTFLQSVDAFLKLLTCSFYELAPSHRYHFKGDVGQVCIRHERGKARAVDAHHFCFRQQDQARCRTQATQRDSLCNNTSSLWIFFVTFYFYITRKAVPGYRNGILQYPVPYRYLVLKYVNILGDRRRFVAHWLKWLKWVWSIYGYEYSSTLK